MHVCVCVFLISSKVESGMHPLRLPQCDTRLIVVLMKYIVVVVFETIKFCDFRTTNTINNLLWRVKCAVTKTLNLLSATTNVITWVELRLPEERRSIPLEYHRICTGVVRPLIGTP